MYPLKGGLATPNRWIANMNDELRIPSAQQMATPAGHPTI